MPRCRSARGAPASSLGRARYQKSPESFQTNRNHFGDSRRSQESSHDIDKVAKAMTDWEDHRFELNFRNQMIIKVFLFHFLTSSTL